MVFSLQRNQEATIYVGNLDESVDDALLTELFTQVRLSCGMPHLCVFNSIHPLIAIAVRASG
jgi:hypothetical protein